jgi:sugar/nucleoside kinase (ribokinase family)
VAGDLTGRKVVVCGDVINDIIVKPVTAVVRGSDTRSLISARPGGSAANQAAWLAYLGTPVVFAGRCGAPDASYHRAELARHGVDALIAADPDAGTGSIVIMVSPDGERTMFTDRGANLRLSGSDVPDRVLDGARVLHLTGYTFFGPALRPVALSLAAAARSRGVLVTIDPGSAAFLGELDPGEFVSWTAGFAVCFPNLDEAAMLTGEREPLAMAAALAKTYPVVALKLGGGGCVLATADGPPVELPAEPADVVDTTGAGDAFCAGFLSQWPDAPPRVAAQAAVRVAAQAVSRLGGRPPAG